MSNRERVFEIDDPTPLQTGWTVASPITSCFQYFRQFPGSERIGGVTLLIEPRQESRSILFVDNLPAESESESEWVPDIISTISAVTVKGMDGRKPIIGLKVTLTGFYSHPIDSHRSAFQLATERALLDGFKAVGLVAWKARLAAE
jgi:hypothetical protein